MYKYIHIHTYICERVCISICTYVRMYFCCCKREFTKKNLEKDLKLRSISGVLCHLTKQNDEMAKQCLLKFKTRRTHTHNRRYLHTELQRLAATSDQTTECCQSVGSVMVKPTFYPQTKQCISLFYLFFGVIVVGATAKATTQFAR